MIGSEKLIVENQKLIIANREKSASIVTGLAGLESPEINFYTGMPIVPGGCGCEDCQGKKTPTVREVQMASRRFRIPGLVKSEKGFFKESIGSVTRMEKEILEGLGLPGIEETRHAVLTGSEDYGSVFKNFGSDVEDKIEAAISRHLNRLFGEPWGYTKAVGENENPIYKKYQLQSVAAGAVYLEPLIENAPGGPGVVASIMADPDYLKFRAMQQVAGQRVRTELLRKNLPSLIPELQQMAMDGEWSIAVAGRIHRRIGEGKAWYYRRFTRTESVLANNLAYDLMSEENNTLYEEWSAGPDACVICMQWQGQVWARGVGPVPVVDSHPHCGCYRIPQYIPGRGDISPAWTRGNPYDNPYSSDEIESIRSAIGNRIAA